MRSRERKDGWRVCIYFKNHLVVCEVSHAGLSNLEEQVWCEKRCGRYRILTGCVYRSDNRSWESNIAINTAIQTAKDLVNKKKYADLLICGDFNYHQIKWHINAAVWVEAPEYSLPMLFLNNMTIFDGLTGLACWTTRM
jgi:hypothetical protein